MDEYSHKLAVPKSVPSVIRVAALRGFRAVVAELGGDADHFAALAGLNPDVLDAEDTVIPARTVRIILETAADTLHCPDLGLRIAARQDLSILGSLSLGIQNSATLLEAFELVKRYLRIHTDAVDVALVDDPYEARGVRALQYAPALNEDLGRQAADLGMGFIHRGICGLVGRQYGLCSVELPHLPRAPIAVYERFFGAPVKIGSTIGTLRLPWNILTNQLSGGGNRRMRACVEALLKEQIPRTNTNEVSVRVREEIHRAIGNPDLNIAAIARVFSIQPRTLQRQLASENTTFQTLVDDVRRWAAWHYLTNSDLPISRIAVMLGLSEQSSLSRCCHRWWSVSPSQIRRESASVDRHDILRPSPSRHRRRHGVAASTIPEAVSATARPQFTVVTEETG